MTTSTSVRPYGCPLCGATDAKVWRRGKGDRLHGLSEDSYVYLRCRKCDARYLDDPPADDDLARFYPDEYEPHTAEERHQSGTAGVPARVVRRVNSSVLRLIDARRPDPLPDALKEFYTPPHPGAALLDYGCGSPAFLESAREAGWETIGVDFSERAVQSVREAGHHGYLAADVEGSVEVGSITAIRMSHSLEHLRHPLDTLSRLFTLLAPGGRIHVAVPNPDSLSSRVFRSRWFNLEYPRHLVLFDETRLLSMLRDAGFTASTVHHEAASKDFVRSAGFALDDARLLRSDAVMQLPYNQLLYQLGLVPSRLLSMIHAGDRMHAFARKQA